MEEPECIVSGALALLLRMSRWIGLAPLSFVRDNAGWRVTRSKPLMIYGNIFLTTILVCHITTMIMDSLLDADKSVYMSTRNKAVVWIVYTFIAMAIVALSGYGSWTQIGFMMISLNKIQKINKDLLGFIHSRRSEKKKTIFVIFWIAVSLCLVFADVVVVPVFDDKISYYMTWMYLSYFFLYFVLLLQILQINLILYNIWNTFVVINDCMREVLRAVISTITEKPGLIPFSSVLVSQYGYQMKCRDNVIGVKRISGKVSSKPHHEVIHELVLAYSKSCAVVRGIESSYGKIMFLLLVSSLTQLIVSPYFLIEAVVNYSKQPHSYVLVIVQMFWCINHVINLILPIEQCHLTQAEMVTLRTLVSHLMRYTSSVYEPLAVELEVFYKQLMLNEASYSPLKIATFERSLVITVLSSISTYMVILTQEM